MCHTTNADDKLTQLVEALTQDMSNMRSEIKSLTTQVNSAAADGESNYQRKCSKSPGCKVHWEQSSRQITQQK